MESNRKILRKDTQSRLGRISTLIFFGLLVYIPFHVFLAHWIGSSFGILEFSKVAKDLVMILGFAGIALAYSGKLRELIVRHKHLTLIIVIYVILSCVITLVHDNSITSEILGLTYNLRLFVFFAYGGIIALSQGEKSIETAFRCVLITGVFTAILGILQVIILPDTALNKVGYSLENGTPEVFYIHDTTKETERAYATIKDPNSFGSYLIIVYLIALLPNLKNTMVFRDSFLKNPLIVALITTALFLSYSRSAWFGGVVAGLFLIWALIKQTNRVKILKIHNISYILVLLITIVLLTVPIHNSNFFKNVILHEAEGKNVTSNSIRLAAYSSGLRKVSENIFGYGVGSAGPVSFKNEPHEAVITENYYIQLAIEVGIPGLILFVCIVALVAMKLYKLTKRRDSLALVLLCSLIGLSVANFFNHIWSNEAVAYTWWGLAGLVMYSRTASRKNDMLS